MRVGGKFRRPATGSLLHKDFSTRRSVAPCVDRFFYDWKRKKFLRDEQRAKDAFALTSPNPSTFQGGSQEFHDMIYAMDDGMGAVVSMVEGLHWAVAEWLRVGPAPTLRVKAYPHEVRAAVPATRSDILAALTNAEAAVVVIRDARNALTHRQVNILVEVLVGASIDIRLAGILFFKDCRAAFVKVEAEAATLAALI